MNHSNLLFGTSTVETQNRVMQFEPQRSMPMSFTTNPPSCTSYQRQPNPRVTVQHNKLQSWETKPVSISLFWDIYPHATEMKTVFLTKHKAITRTHT